MSGLYAKALLYRTQEAVPNLTNEPVAAEEDAGIPLEEQQEILKQIEDVVARNKIAITKETFTLHPQKKGFLFPFLNFTLTIVIITAIFIFLHQAFVQRRGAEILLTQSDTANTESVLARLQKESQQSLANKEKEISNINNQLKALSDEKTKLQDSMQKNIEDKKQELDRELERKIEEEKARLQKAGITLVDINARMEELRKSETGKYNSMMESYRIEEEKKRKEAEEKLAKDISSIQSTLQTAKTDMEKLKTTAAETEKQLQQKLKEQEEAQKQTDQSLLKAEETIKKLSEQRANEQMINDQIDGFYNTIILNLSESNLESAKSNIRMMKDYFNKPEIIALPGIAEKREKNLFLVNALDQMITAEEARKNIDYASLSQKAEIVSSINTKVREADAFYKNNEKDKARLLYEEALNLFPDIKASYVKLLEFNETEKSNQFKNFITAGDESYRNKEYTKAVTSYKSAIKLIPGTGGSLDLLMNNIVEAGYQIKGNSAEKDKDDRLAQQAVVQADIFFSNKSYSEAIDKYLEVLAQYPRSSQVEAARTGIKKSLDSVLQTQKSGETEKDKKIVELEASLKKEQETVALLNTTINTNTTRLKEKEDTLAARDKTISDNSKTITSKEKEIDQLKKAEENLRATINTLEREKKTAEEKLAASGTKATPAPQKTNQKKTEQPATSGLKATPTPNSFDQNKTEQLAADSEDIKAYQALQEQIALLKSQYSRYTEQEDSALRTNGPMGYLSTRPALGEILSFGLLADIFPDLYNRLKAYDDALVDDALKAGTDQALEKLLDVIDNFYNLDKNQSKIEFWKAQKQQYKDEPLFLEILDELQQALTP